VYSGDGRTLDSGTPIDEGASRLSRIKPSLSLSAERIAVYGVYEGAVDVVSLRGTATPRTTSSLRDTHLVSLDISSCQ
jgi:hypothetical protein